MEPLRSKRDVRRLYREFMEARRPEVDLAFLLQDWSDAYNVGGMFRVADACGARELFATGKTPQLPNPMIGVTSLGHHRRIPSRYFLHHEDGVLAAKERGYQLIAVEIAEGAVCYIDFDYAEKVCLVLGNEEIGLYPKVLRHCDAAVFVPMFGKGRSMNVHVTAAVVGYHVLMSRSASPVVD